MNGNSVFVDTNILVYLLNENESALKILNHKKVFISVITEMEMLCSHKLTESELVIIQSLIDDCIVINLNNEIKQEAIYLRRHYKLKLPDCIVAATASYVGLPIITADNDFSQIAMEYEVQLFSPNKHLE